MSLRIAVAGLVVAVIGMFIGFLNWVLPFAAIGPSPVPNPFVSPTPVVDPTPPLPTPSPTPIPPATPPVVPVTVPPPPTPPLNPPMQKRPKTLPPKHPAPPERSTEEERTPSPQPQVESPPPDPGPVATPKDFEDPVETPQVSVGDQIVVTAEPLQEPRGPRPRSHLYYPPIPATDAVRSHLAGGVIACQVTVSEHGQAQALCNSNLKKLAPFFLRRAEAVLEQAEWDAANDENGKPCTGVATVRFRMN